MMICYKILFKKVKINFLVEQNLNYKFEHRDHDSATKSIIKKVIRSHDGVFRHSNHDIITHFIFSQVNLFLFVIKLN